MTIKPMNTSLFPGNKESPELNDDVTRDWGSGTDFFVKVAVILLTQLAGTGWVYGLFKVIATRLALQDLPYMYYILLLACTAILFPFLCWREARHAVPYNYMLLTAITVVFAMGVGPFVSLLPGMSLIGAMMGTMTLILMLWLIAIGMNFDFTIAGAIISFIAFCWTIFWVGIQLHGISRESFVAGLGMNLLVFSLVFIADTQIMLGRRKSSIFSDDEYIIGASLLYCYCQTMFVSSSVLLTTI